jgi:hypothetical protein
MKVYVLEFLVHFLTPKFTFTVKSFVRDGYLFARFPQMIIVENHFSMCSSKILPTLVFGNLPDAALSKLLLSNP